MNFKLTMRRRVQFGNRFVPVNWKMNSIIVFVIAVRPNETRVVFDTRENKEEEEEEENNACCVSLSRWAQQRHWDSLFLRRSIKTLYWTSYLVQLTAYTACLLPIKINGMEDKPPNGLIALTAVRSQLPYSAGNMKWTRLILVTRFGRSQTSKCIHPVA